MSHRTDFANIANEILFDCPQGTEHRVRDELRKAYAAGYADAIEAAMPVVRRLVADWEHEEYPGTFRHHDCEICNLWDAIRALAPAKEEP